MHFCLFLPAPGNKNFEKIKKYATQRPSHSLHGCQEPERQEITYETEEAELEQMIRRIIRAAVESFPIDRTKKADILQRLIGEKLAGGEHHEL